jgi:anaerobic selenocysteine-containing dehydrogenase
MTHYRSCNLCEAMCGVAIETDGDRVVSVRGDDRDPFSKGYICPKATSLADIHHDPDRLRRPLRRKGRDFEEIDWETALDEVAARLVEIRKTHGRRAVAVYLGNPTIHNLGATLYSQIFQQVLGSHSKFSATSVDQLPRMLTALQLYGHQLLMSVPDIDRTDLFVAFGANPAVSNGSLMSAPGMRHRLAEVRKRGGRVVIFDPRRTETADLADEHHFIRPGSDALALLGILHTVFDENLVRLGRLASMVKSLDALRALTKDFSPERTAAATGVSADVVRRVARELARTPRAALYGRVGVSVQEFGGLATWLVEVINLVTGHLDEEGGMMFTTPAADTVKLATLFGQRGHFNKFKSRVRGAPEFGGELPVSCLAEEIETEGDGRIRALVTHAGNPVLSTPNGRRLDAALAQLDFMVSIDIYLNETTRHAHVILPTTFALEHEHYDLALHTYAVRNTAKWSPALFARGEDQRHDWEIFRDLSARLLRKGDPLDPVRTGLAGLALGPLTPRAIVAQLILAGPYGVQKSPFAPLTLAQVENSIHGVDLGPLRRSLPERLETPDGAIDLAPEVFVHDLPRLREALAKFEAQAQGALVMISRRQLRSNNSWGHNSERMVKGRERCTLLVNPADALQRDLRTGDRARVASRVGAIEAPVEVSDEMMPGVVCLPHGFGHAREGVRMRVASAHAGVSVNDITDEAQLDTLCGTSTLSGVPVEVTRAGVRETSDQAAE